MYILYSIWKLFASKVSKNSIQKLYLWYFFMGQRNGFPPRDMQMFFFYMYGDDRLVLLIRCLHCLYFWANKWEMDDELFGFHHLFFYVFTWSVTRSHPASWSVLFLFPGSSSLLALLCKWSERRLTFLKISQLRKKESCTLYLERKSIQTYLSVSIVDFPMSLIFTLRLELF